MGCCVMIWVNYKISSVKIDFFHYFIYFIFIYIIVMIEGLFELLSREVSETPWKEFAVWIKN